jgi:Uri superfamily endonuclease
MTESLSSPQKVAKGSYLLLLRLASPALISVGRLGPRLFPAGYYTYTGSAMGPGGLSARVARHQRKTKVLHWHIDYLTAVADIVEVRVEENADNRECQWSDNLRKTAGTAIVPRFGSSDCSCISHLLYFPESPVLDGCGTALTIGSTLLFGTS